MEDVFVPKKVRRHKSLRFFKTPGGSHVIILPNCRIPAQYLVPENWDENESKSNLGNMRQVKKITHLRNSKKIQDKSGGAVHFYVKSPERAFALRTAMFLGGKENPYGLWNNPNRQGVALSGNLVERLVNYEARILLGLKINKIRAEEPQAIVIHSNGQKELIIRGIKTPLMPPLRETEEVRVGKRRVGKKPLDVNELKEKVGKIGMIPADLGGTRHNIVYDRKGRGHVIDVNRWIWPPHTDKYREALLDAVAREIERLKNTKN